MDNIDHYNVLYYIVAVQATLSALQNHCKSHLMKTCLFLAVFVGCMVTLLVSVRSLYMFCKEAGAFLGGGGGVDTDFWTGLT